MARDLERGSKAKETACSLEREPKGKQRKEKARWSQEEDEVEDNPGGKVREKT